VPKVGRYPARASLSSPPLDREEQVATREGMRLPCQSRRNSILRDPSQREVGTNRRPGKARSRTEATTPPAKRPAVTSVAAHVCDVKSCQKCHSQALIKNNQN